VHLVDLEVVQRVWISVVLPMIIQKGWRSVSHLVENLKVNVRNDWGAELFFSILEEIYVIYNSRLPVHEFLKFVEFRCRELHDDSARQIKGLFVL